jgi:hypothetical protein
MSESLCIDSPFRGPAMPKSYSGDLRERVIVKSCEVWFSRFFRPSASLLVIFVSFCAGSAVCGCGFAHEGRTPSTLLLPAQALSAAPTAIIAITLPMALLEETKVGNASFPNSTATGAIPSVESGVDSHSRPPKT